MPNTNDIAKLKHIDLKAYLEQVVTFKRCFSSKHGGGHEGPCPICGGDDRFRVYPALGLCHCRQCSPSTRWEDIISITGRMRGTGFNDTCNSLLSVADGLPVADVCTDSLQEEPSSEWRSAGDEVVKQCKAFLWAPGGEEIRGYLHNKRHLNNDTIALWNLGYCPESCVIAGLNVHKGIIIPWYFEGILWHLKARVNEKAYGTKYLSIAWADKETPWAGGVPVFYGSQTLKGRDQCVMCEGEFDTMLLHQEAGDLVDVASCGGCKEKIDVRAMPYLIPMRSIYLAYDIDENESGQKGAAEAARASSRIKIVNLWWGNDITEFKQQQGDIHEWVQSFLEPDPQPEIPDELPEQAEEIHPGPGTELADEEPAIKVYPLGTIPAGIGGRDYVRALRERIAAVKTDQATCDLDAPSGHRGMSLFNWLSLLLAGYEKELQAALDRGDEQDTDPWGQPPAPTYDAETADLIEWFANHRTELPTEPFSLDDVAKVGNPAKWYAAIEGDIAAGPAFIRAARGLLKADLGKLKNHVEQKGA